jgi:hypothetical protein
MSGGNKDRLERDVTETSATQGGAALSTTPWESLSPEQQAAEWARQHQMPSPGMPTAPPQQGWNAVQPIPPYAPYPALYRPPAAARPTNVWGVIAMVTAVLTWVIFPILFGLVALVCAIVGDILEHQATGKNSKLCVGALATALLGMVVATSMVR